MRTPVLDDGTEKAMFREYRDMGRPSKLEQLTEDQRRSLLEAIRGGSFPHIAGKACGVAPSTWFRWMQLGQQGQEPYARFAAEVQQAAAHARVAAEIEVRKSDPLAWLRWGPGRERGPDEPGWTSGQTAQAVASVAVGPSEEQVREMALTLMAGEIKSMEEPLKSLVVEWLRERRRHLIKQKVAEVRAEIDAQMPRPMMLPPVEHGEVPSDDGA